MFDDIYLWGLLALVLCVIAGALGANPWHLVAYRLAEAASQSNVDMTAVNDPIFSQRNSHFIFSEGYDMLAVIGMSLHATNFRSNIPSWNAIGRHRVWPIELGAAEQRMGNYPRIQDFRQYPMRLPVNEEIAWEMSTSSSGATSSTGMLAMYIAPTGSINFNVPRSNERIVEQCTATISSSAGLWSGPNALTFSDNLRGGWYVVNGCWVFQNSTAAPATLFRLFFPRAVEVNGRILRPGSYVTDQIGNMEVPGFNNGFGEWGRFHTFEPPQIEVINTNAALSSAVFNVRMDISYLGTNPTY